METRKLYVQGKSTVIVLPSKFLKALKWTPNDYIDIVLLPNMTLNLSRAEHSRDFFPDDFKTPNQTKEAPNADH